MAAFYFGSDEAFDEAMGRALTREELIEEGMRERAAMRAEDLGITVEEAMVIIERERAEMLADAEIEERAGRTMADLVHEVSGEDTAGMKGTTYRSWCEELCDAVDQEDRNHYYRTGLMVGTLAEYAGFYRRG